MTYYIAAYDTESAECLPACRQIVRVHRKYDMPATFFITGQTLEANPKEYRDLLDDPLFEVASHTYSHQMLRDHPFCGPSVSAYQQRDEIMLGKAAVERVFERPCIGLRPGCGFADGLHQASDVLQCLVEAGIQYVSSILWGRDYSLPAPLNQPFTYADNGFPNLWELPGHGWHENLLKNHNLWGARRITLWPPEIPEATPPTFITCPEDEWAINCVFMEKAIGADLCFVSLIWHPWSLATFDPEMKMLEYTFAGVSEMGLKSCTYASLCQHLSN